VGFVVRRPETATWNDDTVDHWIRASFFFSVYC